MFVYVVFALENHHVRKRNECLVYEGGGLAAFMQRGFHHVIPIELKVARYAQRRFGSAKPVMGNFG